MIIIKFFLIYYIIVVCAGICAGYVMDLRNHALEKYFKEQRKSIKKRGEIIAFFYRNYKAYYKKDDKFVYTKCFNYAKKMGQEDINYAITYLKADIKIFDAIGLLVTVCVGLSSPIINSYVGYFIEFLGVENEKVAGNLVGLFYILFMVLFVRNIALLMRKQMFLLNILECAKECVINKNSEEHSS